MKYVKLTEKRRRHGEKSGAKGGEEGLLRIQYTCMKTAKNEIAKTKEKKEVGALTLFQFIYQVNS